MKKENGEVKIGGQLQFEKNQITVRKIQGILNALEQSGYLAKLGLKLDDFTKRERKQK